MSKIYVKNICFCNECPAIKYIHFDGEGVCAPYSYHIADCGMMDNRRLPHELIHKLGLDDGTRKTNVPKRDIPDWCPLKNLEKERR